MRLFILIFLIVLQVSAQEDAWIYFNDKENTSVYLADPTLMLTQDAIDRKAYFNIPIDFRDVPVSENYIATVESSGVIVMAKSKWLNAVHVRGTIQDISSNISEVFVDKIDFADKTITDLSRPELVQEDKFEEQVELNSSYGNTANQTSMIEVDYLHGESFNGEGIKIAVLDAGYPNVNTMGGFQYSRDLQKIKAGYDFVNNTTDVYQSSASNHGTLVLSTMAGYIEDQFVGTAIDATYYLFLTEDANNENPVEESYWVEAAEAADSLGVDIINSSLGYTTYDNANYSYSNADMNGITAFITRGADIAADKGILVVNSAGNSGNSSWKIVGAPADASGVFSIGAVDSNGLYAFFSSLGSSDQPTQKPDVVAQGQGSAVITEFNTLGSANGTSFSSPIIAGSMACLWQANPHLTNFELMQVVRETASQFNAPDSYLGYGIPNFKAAHQTLSSTTSIKYNVTTIYPNPVQRKLVISSDLSTYDIAVFDSTGNQVLKLVSLSKEEIIDVSSLSIGVYFIQINSDKSTNSFKFLKE